MSWLDRDEQFGHANDMHFATYSLFQLLEPLPFKNKIPSLRC
jgi:hypothetical protein